ncbi:hypothetical protein SLOPH_495 [Spraguea lophii 42_110]|uniref:Uncharacterized protein n=1 Tax=Spraguea lophii (strain 42_110) TaxID=1358809 RepID=S7W633_SPRLO|nr:hypothetical protein SLOPH_495 [Spraguea lophii 42_110]
MIYLLNIMFIFSKQADKKTNNKGIVAFSDQCGNGLKLFGASCSTPEIVLSDEDRKSIEVNPSTTEIAAEATGSGLVPVLLFTLFASPETAAYFEQSTVPPNVGQIVKKMFNTMIARGFSNQDLNEKEYTFMKGNISKVAEQIIQNKKDKKKCDEITKNGKEEKTDKDSERKGLGKEQRLLEDSASQ